MRRAAGHTRELLRSAPFINSSSLAAIPLDAAYDSGIDSVALRLSVIEHKLDILLGYPCMQQDQMGFPSACGIPGEQLATQCSASRIIQRGWKRYRRNAEIDRRISTHGSSGVAATVEPFGEQLNHFFAELPEPSSTAADAPASCPDYLLSCVGSWDSLPQILRDTGLGEELRVEDRPENTSTFHIADAPPQVAVGALEQLGSSLPVGMDAGVVGECDDDGPDLAEAIALSLQLSSGQIDAAFNAAPMPYPTGSVDEDLTRCSKCGGNIRGCIIRHAGETFHFGCRPTTASDL